jgi:hypothetical protein
MSYQNKDRFGNVIHDGDIVFYSTSSRYANERIGKVFFQKNNQLGMMSHGHIRGADRPVGSADYDYFEREFKPERRWYEISSAIVITTLVPQLIIDKLDEAYDNWRKKNGSKEF